MEEKYIKKDEDALPHIDSDEDVLHELVPSDSRMPITVSKNSEVTFVSGAGLNGDAKLEMENEKSAFSGMTKDELLKYVNDPFWVRMRMVLFILFWLIWIAMFAAAIAIIVMAPRCVPPKPRKWIEKGPVYDIDENAFVKGNGLKDLTQKLNYLSDLKVKGIILSSFYEHNKEKSGVVDFKRVDPSKGSFEEMKTFLNAAKEKSIHILAELMPNHVSITHDWFNKSAAKVEPYSDYFVWSSAAGTASDGSKNPPNNWLSVQGGPAWTWNEDRKQFYLHQFASDQPDLNFHNPKVRQEFDNILSYWLDIGFSGFYIDKAQYLLEDKELRHKEVGTKPGFTQDQYDFYSHVNTYNLPDVANILSSWRNLTEAKTKGTGVLVLNGDAPIPTDSNATTRIVDYVRPFPLLHQVSADKLTINLLHDRIQSRVLAKEWPVIEIGGGSTSNARIVDVFGDEAVDPLNIITLLLPGIPLTKFGDELGLSRNETILFLEPSTTAEGEKSNASSHLDLYKTMAGLRSSPAVLHGETNVSVVDNTLVVARWKSGSPGYVALYNASPTNATVVNLSSFEQLPSELTVFAMARVPASVFVQNSRLPTSALPIAANSAVVFTFVPTEEEGKE